MSNVPSTYFRRCWRLAVPAAILTAAGWLVALGGPAQLVAVGAAVFVLAAVGLRPWVGAGMLTILVAAALDDLQRLPGSPGISATRVLALIVVSAWLLDTAARGRRFRVPLVAGLLFALALCSGAGALSAGAPAIRIVQALSFVGYGLLVIIIADRFTDSDRYRVAMKAFVLLAALIGIVAAVQFYSGRTLFGPLLGSSALQSGGAEFLGSFAGRSLGTATNPNAGALVPVIAIPLAVALILTERRGRVVWAGALTLCLSHVVFSLSRSAWLAVIVSGILLVILLGARWWWTLGALAIGASALVLLLMPAGMSDVVVQRIAPSTPDAAIGVRRAAVIQALPEFVYRHGVFGVGPGGEGFAAFVDEVVGVSATPHNIVVGVFAAGGVIGLVVYLTALGLLVHQGAVAMSVASPAGRILQAGLLVAVVAWQVHGIFHNYLTSVLGWYMIAMASAHAGVLLRQERAQCSSAV